MAEPATALDELTDADRAALAAAVDELRRHLAAGVADHTAIAHRMLTAAHRVYEAAETAAVDRLLDETLFAGMEINDDGIRMRIKFAAQLANAMAEAFGAWLDQHPDAENYIEQTITHRATADRYTAVIAIVRPGRKTPHQLRQAAEHARDALHDQLGTTIAALNVALACVDPATAGSDEIAGCRLALADAIAAYEAGGGTRA